MANLCWLNYDPGNGHYLSNQMIWISVFIVGFKLTTIESELLIKPYIWNTKFIVKLQISFNFTITSDNISKYISRN